MRRLILIFMMSINVSVLIICRMITSQLSIRFKNHSEKIELMRLNCICRNIRIVRDWIFNGGMISMVKRGFLIWFYVGVSRCKKGFNFRLINRLFYKQLMIEENGKFWISIKIISEILRLDSPFISVTCSHTRGNSWTGCRKGSTIQTITLSWWLTMFHLLVSVSYTHLTLPTILLV